MISTKVFSRDKEDLMFPKSLRGCVIELSNPQAVLSAGFDHKAYLDGGVQTSLYWTDLMVENFTGIYSWLLLNEDEWVDFTCNFYLETDKIRVYLRITNNGSGKLPEEIDIRLPEEIECQLKWQFKCGKFFTSLFLKSIDNKDEEC